MAKSTRWRVRVKRVSEDWIEVQAESALQAEEKAISIPNIVNVFAGSTISGEKPLDGPRALRVEDEE